MNNDGFGRGREVQLPGPRTCSGPCSRRLRAGTMAYERRCDGAVFCQLCGADEKKRVRR